MKKLNIDKIHKNAISLEKFGLKDLAWKKNEAISLINELLNEDIGIYGGDVYEVNFNKLIPTYDNWYCEINKFESKEDFFLRTKIETLKYLNNFNENNKNLIFSITFTELVN